MVSARSTSPPKSAWPGVSTRLILTPFHVMDAALARMVMPRSRSWSLESMHAVDDRLVGSEGTGGAQQRIDECGFAVVDVGDQSNVTKRS